MVKIASRWTKNSPLNVRVFSNCDKVELFLNGKSLGIQKPDTTSNATNLAHPPFTFKINSFEKGQLVAKGFFNDKEIAMDAVRTPETATNIQLFVDYSGKHGKSNRNDVLFVYAKLVDKNGTVVPQNDIKIEFYVEGDAELVSPTNATTEAGIATALVRLGTNKTPTIIKAKLHTFLAELPITVE